MIRSLFVRSSSSSRRSRFVSSDIRRTIAIFQHQAFVDDVCDVGEATSPSSQRRRSYHSTIYNRYSHSYSLQSVEEQREQDVVVEERKETTTPHKSRSRRRPKYQEIAYDFIEKVASKQIPSEVVCQKVQEILLQVLLEGKHSIIASDAPLALELLNLSVTNANPRGGEKILPRLFNLSIQIMVHSRHKLAVTEIQKQLFRLLSYREEHLGRQGGYYFTNADIVYNSCHVNDAFYQLISLVCGNEVTARANKTKTNTINYKTKQNIKKLMNRLEELYDDPDVALERSSDGCDAFVRYYCIIEQNPTKAYQYLKQMMKSTSNDDEPPLVSTFTNTIAAYAKSGNPDKALEIIEWMLASYNHEDSTMPAPNGTCFNALLDAYARSGRDDAGNKAEQILKWMKRLHRDPDNPLETEPDEISYATAINAWARCSATNPEAPNRAEHLLKKLIELYHSGREIQITEYAFTSVMNAWASSNIHTDIAPVKIRELIHLMHEIEGEKPTTIDSSDTKNTNKKMLEVTAIPYSILIKSWEKRAKNAKNPNIRNQCGEEALQVLEEMKNARIDPLPGTYNAIITTLQFVSFSSALLYFLELEDEFQHQLQQQQQQQQHANSKKGSMMLDTRTFNCGLNVIATMNKPDASERAFNILNRMIDYSKCSDLYPDETTYNIILKILSKDYHNDPNDSAIKAQKLLEEMTNVGDDDDNNKIHRSIRPSHWSYLPTMMAWGRSTSSDKFDCIQNLLQNYEEQSHYSTYQQRQPMMISLYNAALSCCYHNDDPMLVNEAVKTAIFTINKMRNMKQKTGLQPDYLTYLNFFRAMAIAKEISGADDVVKIENHIIDREFQSCISDGLVSKEIVELLHKVSPPIFHQYFGGDDDDVERKGVMDVATINIPRAWKKNYNKKNRQQQSRQRRHPK